MSVAGGHVGAASGGKATTATTTTPAITRWLGLELRSYNGCNSAN